MIVDPECFSIYKYTDPVEVLGPTFNQQFQREFSFDSTMQTVHAPFNAMIEWSYVSNIVAHLENNNPVLRKFPEF